MKTRNLFKILSITALISFTACAGKNNETDNKNEKVKVKVETVHIQDVDQLSEFMATVEANITNKIAPQSPVRIQKLHVEVGDKVRAGQLLATMDANNLKQSKIQLDNQEIEFKRIDELYKVGGASKSAWDAQKASLEVSREAYKNLQENNQLLSPINGTISVRNYDNGDMYDGATPVFIVEQVRPVKLMVNVSESFYPKVKKGMEVAIKLDVYGNEQFGGKVNLVYPSIDPSTRTFPVEIRMENNDERVRPGMFARVTMNFGTIQNVVVPDQAIIKQTGAGDLYVYVYNNGNVSYNKVELGRRMGNRYEVISGINDGDQVVITGINRLTNGMEVEVIN